VTTKLEQDNAVLVRQGFEAFAKGDLNSLTELFHPEAVWLAVPRGVLVGAYHGRDAIVGHFLELHRETDGTFRSLPKAIAGAGDQVFIQSAVSGERHGRIAHWDEVLVFTLEAGTVREVRLFIRDLDAQTTFWS